MGNGTKICLASVIGFCLWFGLGWSVAFADVCDDMVQKAQALTDSAAGEARQGRYQAASELYLKAGRYFQQASEMKNCRCPKIEKNALKAAEACKKNAAINKENYRKEKTYKAELKEYETVQQANAQYNRGNDHARQGEWQDAVDCFERAAKMYERVASSDTANGQAAKNNASQARKLATLARQRMGQ